MEPIPRISAVELSAIAHATEAFEKVQLAILNLVPPELRGRVSLTTQNLKGHHGNPITAIRVAFKGKKLAEDFVKYLAQNLERADKSSIALEFDRHADDEGNLYLRVDKQAAYTGRARLMQEDPIRIKIKFDFRPASVQALRKACERLGLIT